MKKLLVFSLVLSVLIVGVAWAGDCKIVKQDKKEVCQVSKELKQAKENLGRLNSLVEQWHQACLAMDEKKINQYEQAMYNFIITDINASFHAVQKAEDEAGRSRKQWQSGNEQNRDVADEYADCLKARKILSNKEGVLFRLKNSDSFSLKYRLLSEYRGLIREELGMNRWELAENVREVKQDK